MTTGNLHDIFVGTKRVTYREYKLQLFDRNKKLAQIAFEQLGDEKPALPIYKKKDNFVPGKDQVWEPVKDPLDPNWTLLLPPSDYASIIINDNEIVRTSPKVENNNQLYTATKNSTFLYKKNTVIVDTANNMVWAEVSKTDPKKNGGRPYYICVKYGSSNRTTPPVNGPSN